MWLRTSRLMMTASTLALHRAHNLQQHLAVTTNNLQRMSLSQNSGGSQSSSSGGGKHVDINIQPHHSTHKHAGNHDAAVDTNISVHKRPRIETVVHNTDSKHEPSTTHITSNQTSSASASAQPSGSELDASSDVPKPQLKRMLSPQSPRELHSHLHYLKEIHLIRHGESKQNTHEEDPQKVGDHRVQLSEHGHKQAESAGHKLHDVLRSCVDGNSNTLVYCSPYVRCQQTLSGILKTAFPPRDGVNEKNSRPHELVIYEDPRLREIERGYSELERQNKYRERHGFFWYRFEGGESPADCFDRVSNFLESMMRQIEHRRVEKVVIVSHGLTIRCFITRFLHLNIDTFDNMKNLNNCDVVSLKYDGENDEVGEIINPQSRWGVKGVKLYEHKRHVTEY